MTAPIRVFFQCTGVGIFNRGIESFFREAFDGLQSTPGLEAHLIKGAGAASDNEHVPWCLPRTGAVARQIGRLTGRNGYVAEQWSSYFGVARLIQKLRPEVVFYSDANLGFLLYQRRRRIGVPFRLLFSNGGPTSPPFTRRDAVQQVAPPYMAEALAAGEPADRQFLIPYGIRVPGTPPTFDAALCRGIRAKLGLPQNRQIVLSVGWIARKHKRMHYVIEEMARLPQPRPFLQLLGAIDEASPEIIALGNRLLGPEHFSAKSVPYAEVALYYQAADCFVLASLQEGFGRVYLESLMHGLPTIGHRHPVIEYVLGQAGTLADLSKPGILAELLAETLRQPADGLAMQARWQSVRARFGWPALAESYRQMFVAAAQLPIEKLHRP